MAIQHVNIWFGLYLTTGFDAAMGVLQALGHQEMPMLFLWIETRLQRVKIPVRSINQVLRIPILICVLCPS